AFAQALADVGSLDVEIVETGGLPRHIPYRAIVQSVINGEMASIFADLVESGRVDELRDARQVAGLKASLTMPARLYNDAMRARPLVQEAFADIFERCDAILTVGRARGPTRLDE